MAECPRCEPVVSAGAGVPHVDRPAGWMPRVALVGNPNTGKTTLFNRLSGLRLKTGNFPGTTQEARSGVGRYADGRDFEIIDLPGVYSLELEQVESAVCRDVLAGTLAPPGEAARDPDAVCIVADGSNLPRNLVLAGEVLRRRLPTVVAVNMMDLAEADGLAIDTEELSRRLGTPVVPMCARSGRGVDVLRSALASAPVPNQTPPGTVEGLEAWADEVFASAATLRTPRKALEASSAPSPPSAVMTDRVDRVVMHRVLGPVLLLAVMTGLFWTIFSVAQLPMDLIDTVFSRGADAARAVLEPVLGAGVLVDLAVDGVIRGIGATVIFLPQICLLFFLISLLEDTGYLARAAMLLDRLLRPFGLPGHAFMPLLSSHACALPGIMAARAVPDARDRLATILVAPFMTCSARLPVYVLLTTLLFRDRPLMAAMAFVGCYLLGIVAGLVSALIARRTILRGKSRPMALELPTYKLPSLRTALLTTWDRGWTFLKNAGTNILAICIVLWWLSSYPKVEPPPASGALHQQVADAIHGWRASSGETPEEMLAKVEELQARADEIEARHALANSFAGRLGRTIQPVFAPLGFDWQLSVGVLTSFAAREVFVSTMAVITTGQDDPEGEGVMERVQSSTRTDGRPIFTVPVAWGLLVYYVLAMQCLPTLAVTAKEAGGVRWALLQLAWMCGVAYAAALIVYQTLVAAGVS